MSHSVSMSMLGRHGRFGNQLFQYAFLRLVARQFGATLEIPPWVGRPLFGLEDPPVSQNLPVYQEQWIGGDPLAGPVIPDLVDVLDHDFHGYAQFHTSWYRPHREFIRGLFQPTPEILDRVRRAARRLCAMGNPTRIGFHFRRGDYGRYIFYLTPVAWYRQWLEENWARFEDPVLFIATEDPAIVAEFADYGAVGIEQLGVELRQHPMPEYTYLDYDLLTRDPRAMDFYPEFYLLSQCDVLAIPNSTFSFTAAMLAENLRECWRSDLWTRRFVPIDPWDAHPLTHDKAEDFPDVPGIRSESNPYW